MKKIIVTALAVMMLAYCGIGGNTAAVVGKEKVTVGEFQFYLASIKSQMKDTELQTDEDWETQEIEGEKAIDVARQRAADTAVKNVEYCELAKKMGLKLTDTEKQQVKSVKSRVISGYGGESEYKKYLKENKISDGFIDMMCESTMYHKKLTDKVTAEDPVTADECRKYYDENRLSLETEYRKAKHILILTADPQTMQEYSAEQQEEAKKLAEELLKRAESGENFDTLMKRYSQDSGLSTNPDGYVFGSDEMVAEFENATDSIGFDEITMCKSSYGYHIIKRLQPSYEDLEQYVSEKALEEKLDKKMRAWAEEYNLNITINEDILKGDK